MNGRIFQDNNFIFKEFNGLKLEGLVSCENPETDDVVLVFIKVENHFWHRFFIDFGCGFWENWNEETPETDDEAYRYTDQMQQLKLFGKIIKHIECNPQDNGVKISIIFTDNTQFVLKSISEDKNELVVIGN